MKLVGGLFSPVTSLAHAIGIGGGGDGITPPALPASLPTPQRDDAAAAVAAADTLRRRRGGAADLLTGAGGAEAGATGKTKLGQ